MEGLGLRTLDLIERPGKSEIMAALFLRPHFVMRKWGSLIFWPPLRKYLAAILNPKFQCHHSLEITLGSQN